MIRKLGVLSDTHGRSETAVRAVALLNEQNVDALIHCGDIGTGHEGRAVLDALVGDRPVWFVWGNTDYDSDELEPYAESLGLHCLGLWGQVLWGPDNDTEPPIAVHHGHDSRLYQRIIDEQAGGYLLSGHTHVSHDDRRHGVRLLNPGALHRAATKTVATLEPTEDRWTLHEL